MVANPSEYFRLMEERNDLIHKIKTEWASKHTKAVWLRAVRAIERQLGLPGEPYNSSAFGGSDGESGR